MIEINELNNTSVLLSSLEKIYNQGRLTGKLKSIDLYILNMIFKLLNGCCLELTHPQRRQLMDLYRQIYLTSDIICPTSIIKSYEVTKKNIFFQAETEDCNQYPIADKIYYWQEENLSTTIENILLLIDNQGYFLNKLYDTKESFYIGKNINYIEIGKICFAITEAKDTDTYKIYDSLNNDVTHTFDRVFVPSIKTILFVSQNTYSHGTMFFKFKKTTEIFDSGIFNDTFNDTFN